MIHDYSGERLRSLRKRSRLTQAEVLKLTGISEATLCYLERGTRKAQTNTLQKLLNLYAMKIQYWNNVEKVFEENPNGSIPSQATVRPGSSGVDPVRTPQKVAHERQVPASHGLPRLQGQSHS